MLKRIPIRLRFTLLTALLLTICCIGLTLILNVTAYNAVDKLDAIPLIPSVTGTTAAPETPKDSAAIFAVPTTEAQAAKRGFSLQSILYMLLTVIGGSALTYYISGKVLKPLTILNGQVKNLTVHNLSESLLVPPTKDEISELTASFNQMTDKLNEAFLMQQQFSASAAHELRTPLAVLQAKVDVFRKQSAHTTEEYDDLVEVINNQTLRLRKLVGTLLDMTNMDGGDEVTTIQLDDIIENIVAELSTIAGNNDVKLIFTLSHGTVTGNIDLLYRAFYNLIENSIKYNVKGGNVRITVSTAQQGQTEILIADTGIGIPEDQKKHIFEPFYRVDKSRSREMGGAGLGLCFVESVIKKHGGKIEVFDNLNGGSCFRILLKK